MALKYFSTGADGTYVCYGISTDTKPSSPPDNCIFIEIDTAKRYKVSTNAWVEAINSSYVSGTHNHDSAYEAKNTNIQTHVVSAHAPANAQANADITKAEIEAKLTGAISSHSHTGGSDPWTYIKLASDFTTSSATAVDVTGLAFTPAANLDYEFNAVLRTRTNTATVGPRPGLAWATGLNDTTHDSDGKLDLSAALQIGAGQSVMVMCLSGGPLVDTELRIH